MKTKKQPRQQTEKPNTRKTQRPRTAIGDLSSVELSDLATAGECSISYVSRVFSRNRHQSRGLTLRRAKAFADYLGVTLDQLHSMITG